MRLRLATANIAHGRGQDRRVDLRRTTALLSGLDADVLCLQEVDRHYGPRSGWADQVAVLAEALGMASAYGAAVCRPRGRGAAPAHEEGQQSEYGNAVLSRIGLGEPVVHPLPVPARAEPRCLLLVPVGGLLVGCVHLTHNYAAARAAQAAALLQLLPRGEEFVLAGDFNADAADPELRLLSGRLTDAWTTVHRTRSWTRRFRPGRAGATFPSGRPRRRLDHVYLAGGVRAVAARVVPTDASDHRPLVVDVELPDRLGAR